jgi:hypothetical protein
MTALSYIEMNDAQHSNGNYVICKLPRAGLGNKLLVWAKALVFARLNNLPLFVSPWAQISIGSFLRLEKQRRFYADYFQPYGWQAQFRRLYLEYTQPRIDEPQLTTLDLLKNHIYVFSKIPHWSHYFRDLKAHRDFIKQEIWRMLSQKYHAQLAKLKPPLVSIHIRQGDFRVLKAGEDFASLGLVRTPSSYFVRLIHLLRRQSASKLPITIFSDGYTHELKDILNLPDIQFVQGNAAIVDMLLMSQSKLLIFSAGSTFSYWSGFLSDAAILHHPQHYHGAIRDEQINQQYFEGRAPDSINTLPELLIKNMRDLL